MKRVFVIAIVVLLAGAMCVSYSQVKMSFGPKLGIVLANASFDPDLPSAVTKSSRTGFSGGAAFEVMFPDIPLGIEADLLYTMGGTVLEGTVGTTKVTDTEKLTFIQIPVLLKGKFATKSIVSPYVYAGPALGITASAKELVEAPGYTSQETDVKDNTTGTDFSLVFGGGAEFKIESKVGLTFDVRYGLGLTDMNKNPQPGDSKVKTRGLSFLVGAMFTL
jgi:outer membrane protein W